MEHKKCIIIQKGNRFVSSSGRLKSFNPHITHRLKTKNIKKD